VKKKSVKKPIDRRTLSFGVTKDDVTAFVESDGLVKQFLAKYAERPRTYADYGRALCMFFKWLRVCEGVKLSPTEFLNLHFQKSKSQRVEDQDWACGLVLKFCRDNPVWRDSAGKYKLTMFIKVKQFFNRYRVPLTLEKGVFGKTRRRKHNPKQMTVDTALKVLGAVKQRERAICMVMFQSGQSMDAILNHFNSQLDYLQECLRKGQKRIRLDFPERKGNSFAYYSYLSVDAIQELQKWLTIRETWLRNKKKTSTHIFIMNNGNPLTTEKFTAHFYRILKRKKLTSGPYMLTSHMFRKLFKTESSPPERGINQDYIEFMMGHMSGIESVGGIYDKTPEIHEEVVEKEYARLEPFLNVYSGHVSESKLSDKDREALALIQDPQVLEWIKRKMKEDGLTRT
jgi:integrase